MNTSQFFNAKPTYLVFSGLRDATVLGSTGAYMFNRENQANWLAQKAKDFEYSIDERSAWCQNTDPETKTELQSIIKTLRARAKALRVQDAKDAVVMAEARLKAVLS